MKKIKMNKIFFLLILFYLLTSCLKPKYIFIKPKPFQFKKTKELPTPSLELIYFDNSIYLAYQKIIKKQIEFHNGQIDDYFNSFKEEKDKE